MSAPVGADGTLLVAGEIVHFDGPWEQPDDLRKLNGVLRFSQRLLRQRLCAHSHGVFGQMERHQPDPAARGRCRPDRPLRHARPHRRRRSARASACPAAGTRPTKDAATRVNAYAIKSNLSLFNNFTYFLNDPVNGDQFRQMDDRVIAGASASRTFFGTALGGIKSETTVGLQTRYDDIARRPLQHTRNA